MSATVHFLYPSELRHFIAQMTEEEREIFSGMVRRYGADDVLNGWEVAGSKRTWSTSAIPENESSEPGGWR